MPLRDHFRPPLEDLRPWSSIHGGWPMVIVQQLNEFLPPQFLIEPQVYLGSPIEIDVAGFDTEFGTTANDSGSENGGVATAVATWAEPTLAIETEQADTDEYEVRIYDVEGGPKRLVAVIEIVSPANKDRPRNRNQFTAKCADLLYQGVSVSIVDLVTTHHFNLYEELLRLLGKEDPALGTSAPSIYAVACRWRFRRRLEVWHYPLAIDQPLPKLPLWLQERLVAPLDLEASYEKTCRDLRIA